MMQRLTVRISALFLVLLLSAPAVAFADEGVAARVGGISISKQQVGWKVQKLIPLFGSFHSGISAEKIAEIQTQALDELIEETLKARYAIAEELAADNAFVEEEYQAAKKKYPSEEEFQKALGGNAAQYRAGLYRKALAKKAEEVAVDSKVRVSEEVVRADYEQKKEMYKMPKQFVVSHILVKVDPASNEEERAALLEKAEGLAQKARDGEDFYNLAYYNSDDKTKYVGGKLPPFHEGQTVPEFEQALLQMKPGETSDAIRTIYGYHIIKLDQINEARQLSYDDMKGKIRERLENKQRQTVYATWMEELKEKYPVERFDQ